MTMSYDAYYTFLNIVMKVSYLLQFMQFLLNFCISKFSTRTPDVQQINHLHKKRTDFDKSYKRDCL